MPGKKMAPPWHIIYCIGGNSDDIAPPSVIDTQPQSLQRHQYLAQKNEDKMEVGENCEEVK